MKNFKKIITFFVFAFMVFGVTNQAHAGWNENKMGNDCSPTTGIQVVTAAGVATGCSGYKSSATAQLGDVINVRLYFRNTSDTDATNTVASISGLKNSSTYYTWTGSLSSSNGNIPGHTVGLTIPVGTKVQFFNGSLFQRNGPNTNLTVTKTVGTIAGMTNVSIGTVNTYKDCLTAVGGGDAFCYQGALVGAYKVVQDNTNPTTYQCNDGADNDSDGKVDYPNDPGCTSATDDNEYNGTTTYACNDGLDNDGDGLIDYPNDPGCANAVDNNEYNSGSSVVCAINSFYASPTTVTSGATTQLYWSTSNCTSASIDGYNYALNGNGIFGPLTSGRTYVLKAWRSEGQPVYSNVYVGVTNSTTYACNDGYDNDSDGDVDYPNDPGCSSYTDTDEYNYTNNNTCEIDTYYASPKTVVAGNSTRLYWRTSNCDQVTIDGVNYPVDGNGYFGPLYSGRNYQIRAWKNGYSPETETEYVGVEQNNPTTYACNDGIDNDGDGRVDYPNDPGCYSYTDGDEYNTTASTGTVITTLNPSNLTPSSGRLNGTVFSGGNNNTNLYFEWGTSEYSLPNVTTSQITTSNDSVTYFDTIRNLATNTTYYYRAVGRKADGTILRGEIKQFRLVSGVVTNTPVFTNTNVITRTVVATTTPAPQEDRGVVVGMGTNLVQLRYITNDMFASTTNTGGFGINQNINNVNNGVQNVCVDDTAKFVVEYRNISTITLSNAILHVDIPKDVDFRSSSAGVFNKADNTITINVGTLMPGQSGQVSFDGIVQSSAANRDLLVVPATLSFENPNNGARETAVAYGLATTQNCVRNNNLAGFAFGSGFFPTTLFGWLLLALVLLAIIYLIRRWFMMYPMTRYSSTKRTIHDKHYEDMDIPTAPYTH